MAGVPLRGVRRVKGCVDSSSGSPRAWQQTRQVNGVNEYTSIAPDGTPPPWEATDLLAVSLAHDPKGNLSVGDQSRDREEAVRRRA
jgi:hypothetical protein